MEDYTKHRQLPGNRRVIKVIAQKLKPCLETNLFATPSKTAKELAKTDRLSNVFECLFNTIAPHFVFVHSNTPIQFFGVKTQCRNFTSEVKQARWQGHEFLLFGRPGPLYTLGRTKGAALGDRLAKYMSN